MVKKRFLILSLLPLLSLTACQKKELRSDIAEFISHFSLSEAKETYKEAGYNSVQVISDSEGVTRVEKKLDFNIKNESNISYSYSYRKYKNEELSSSSNVTIETIDSKYIYTVDSEAKEIDINEAKKVIDVFFYEYEEYEYHNYGVYYGDIVIDQAYDFQNYITIDENKESCKIEYQMSITKEYTVNQKVIVDKSGMLKSNEFALTKNDGSDSSTQTIIVYKK